MLNSHKKALITGGAGFIGSHLARRLLDHGYEVTVLDNLFTGSKANIFDLFLDSKFTFKLHDVTQPFWGQYDEIYNLACPASPVHYQHNPIETLKASVIGITNVLELALKTKAKVFHASTSEIYGDPLVHPQVESYWGNVNTIGVRSCYDEGKRCAETLCRDFKKYHGVDVRMVRIFNTYGPNMNAYDGRVVSNFIRQALNNEDITIYGDGSQTRSFQYCSDLLDAIELFMSKNLDEVDEFFAKRGIDVPVLNVGNPNEYTILELATKVLSKCQTSSSKLVMEKLPLDDPKKRRPDITLAKELLCWQPHVLLNEGLDNTISYFTKLLKS